MFSPKWQLKLYYAASMAVALIVNRVKNPSKQDFGRILIVKEDEIGDLCYSLPVFGMLRCAYPEAEIYLVCRKFAAGLMHGHPALDQVWSNWDEVKGHFDLVVDLKGSYRGLRYVLTHMPAFMLDRGSVRFRNKHRGPHPHEEMTSRQVVERLVPEPCKNAPFTGFTIGDKDREMADEFIRTFGGKAFAVLHSGARRVLRKWPAQRYASLARWIHEKYDFEIVFAGDQSDLKDIERIRSGLNFPIHVAAGELNLGAFTQLTSRASLFVGNESGPLHIAATRSVPCLGLFGPGEPFVFYPKGEKSAVLHHILPCNPCNQIRCIQPDQPCITLITEEEVQEKIKMLLGR